MNELMRYCVLQTALIAALLDANENGRVFDRVAHKELLQELDALTMWLAHRSRSTIAFHKTTGGQAALSDAGKVVDALRAGDESAEWETRRWSLEQASGAIMPDMKPAEVVHHTRDLRGVALLSDFTED